MNKHEQFTWLVAQGMTDTDDYGTECSYCRETIGYDEKGKHADDCAMLQARALLGQEWIDHAEKQKAKEEKAKAEALANIEKIERKRRARYKRVNCDICNKHVSEDGLEAHQRMNKECLERAKKFRFVSVEVTDPWDDINQ